MAVENLRQIAGDKIARCLEPQAWIEYDKGMGVCSNQDGWKCLHSIKQATALMNRWPEIVKIIA